MFDEFLRGQHDSVQLPFLNKKVDPAEALFTLDPKEYTEQLSNWKDEQRQIALGHGSIPKPHFEKNVERFNKLATLVARGRLVPFIGAGVSASCSFPTWTGYLMRLAIECNFPKKVLNEWLGKGQYEEAADRLHEKLGEPGFNEAFDRAFSKDFYPTSKSLADNLLSICNGPVVTTNFDRVLENAPSANFKQLFLGRIPGEFQRAAREGERVLLKIHGDLYQPDSRVLTRKEYDLAYGPAGSVDYMPKLAIALKSLYLRSTLLFIGCSLLLDRTMQLFLRTAESEGRTEDVRHFAIAELPKGLVAFAQREKFLSDRRIFPIWYPNGSHDYAPAIVQQLALAAREAR